MTPSTAIILAGGFGTRLRQAVPDVPKPMAPIHGMPFLCYLLEELYTQGISRVVLSTGYLADRVESHFGAQYKLMEILYSREDRPLGTGGAVKLAIERFNLQGLIVVLNGDTYFPISLASLASRLLATPYAQFAIALKSISPADRYGTVEIDSNGLVTRFTEKGAKHAGLINGGAYVFRAEVFEYLPSIIPMQLESDIFEPLASKGLLIGSTFDAPFIDIGIPEDYDQAPRVIPRISPES